MTGGCRAQPVEQRRRRHPTDEAGEHRERSLDHLQQMLADRCRSQARVAVGVDRVAHEITDGGQHPGDRIGVQIGQFRRRMAVQQQTGFALDQEQVVDAVAQRVLHHHLGEGHAAAPGFEAPGQPARRQAVLQRAIEVGREAAQGLGDRAPDRRADHREQRVDDAPAVAPHRVGQRRRDHRRQRAVQRLAAIAALGLVQEFRQALGQRGFGSAQARQFGLLGGQQDLAQSLELAHGNGRATVSPVRR